MTLNDNPRVCAEHRLLQLERRRAWLMEYKYGRMVMDTEGGITVKMFMNPYDKSRKAGDLIGVINKEIDAIRKLLASFK